MPLLEAKSVSKRLGGKLVVDNVSLALEKGEVVAILGPNGSGKSTLLQLLAGVLRPDDGEVLVEGVPIEEPRARRILSYLPQEEPLYPELTGLENVKALAWMRGVNPDYSVVELLAERLGVREHLDKRVGTYSGGLRRKLSLIAILAQRPRLAILDEPTSGLDPASRREVVNVLREYAEKGSGVLFTTHIGADAEQADRVLFIARGRIVAEGKPEELIARYAPGFTLRLVLSKPREFAADVSSRGFRVYTRREDVIVQVGSEEEFAELARIASHYGLYAMEARRSTLEDAYLAATGASLGA